MIFVKWLPKCPKENKMNYDLEMVEMTQQFYTIRNLLVLKYFEHSLRIYLYE